MKKNFTLFFTLFIANCLMAQNAQVKGTVVDDNTKEPLTGVSVKVDKTRGGITDASGKYTLSLAEGDHDITFSSIGFKAEKMKITVQAGEKKEINVALKSSAIEIQTVESVSQFRKNSATETVSTITVGAEQIKNTNSMDLGEAISKTPGEPAQDGQISIRGGSSYSYGVGSRTAVLQDGLPLMSADLGDAQINMATLSNVKQIEIVKGASSVVYGSGALNGVVNVISSWPSESEPKNEISVNTEIMDRPKLQYQQWWEAPPFANNINFNHQQRVKNIQYVIAANITQIKSFLQFNDQLRMQTVFKLRYLDPKIEGLNYGVNGSFQYERSERFFISTNLDTGALLNGKGSNDRYIRSNLDPFVSYQNSKGHRFTVNTRYMTIFRKGNGTDPNAVGNTFYFNDQYQYRYKNLLVFTAGTPFDVSGTSSNLYRGSGTIFHAAVYSQLEFRYKIMTLQGGLRYEASGVDTQIVSKFPPIFRAGINLQAARATFFRASWGQGYCTPALGEKYIAQQFSGELLIVPNDTLKPETSWNLELGFWQGFKMGEWKGYVDAAFYWQESKNFIEYEVGTYTNRWSNGQQIFPDSLEFGYPQYNSGHQLLGLKPINIENARIAGYEIIVGGIGKIGKVGVTLTAGYTYDWPAMHSDTGGYPIGQFLKDMFTYNFKRVPQSSPDINKILYYRSRHLVRFDVELNYWKFYLGGTITYGSEPEKIPPLFQLAGVFLFGNGHSHDLDTYMQQHIHGDYQIDLRTGMKVNDRIKLGFIVKNLCNRLYDLRPGKPEALRNFTLQFTYSFGKS